MAVEEGKILRLVLSEMAKEGFRYAPVGISVRHVHLSEKDLHVLSFLQDNMSFHHELHLEFFFL